MLSTTDGYFYDEHGNLLHDAVLRRRRSEPSPSEEVIDTTKPDFREHFKGFVGTPQNRVANPSGSSLFIDAMREMVREEIERYMEEHQQEMLLWRGLRGGEQ